MATTEVARPNTTTVLSATPAHPARLLSIDAFRGFTMICMLGEGFGLLQYRANPIVAPIAAQFQHVDWNMAVPRDLHFWDLIQPFFMFIVGAVMPISFARRWANGEPWARSLLHVLRRSALLIVFGLIARSVQANKPVVDLINVLAQVAFTYLVAFLVLRTNWKVQGAVAVILLVVQWALYQFVQAPGVVGPWAKDANIGWYLDRLILHKNWSGSYATINCVSSAANTIFGVMAGELLIAAIPVARKLQTLAFTGAAATIAGLALSLAIPLNKKIWTPSFAIYSAGMTVLTLLLFYWIFDIKEKRRWATLFIVVGSNSIFIYLFHEILHRWMMQTAQVFTGWTGQRAIAALAVLTFEIYTCYWLYQRKIFFKL